MSDRWGENNSQAIWCSYEPSILTCAFATAGYKDKNYQFETVASQEITLSMSQKDGGFVVVNGNKNISHYGLDVGTSNNDKYFHIGGRYVNSSQSTISQFELYEVRIYNRTLSDAEILQNQRADKIKYGLQF